MHIPTKDFRVAPGKRVKLADWPTEVEPFYDSKSAYKKHIHSHVEEMAKLQELFYANDNYSLLIIFQAMDAAGKDSAIRHVMSGLNPQGCNVTSFKHPSAEELDHDFLWRTTRHTPERGMIGVFNRSYYEEVLVVRVHPEILHAQKIPSAVLDEKKIWKERFESINDFEKHLHRNGTKILKFFLHLSKQEQKKRFLRRIEHRDKNWKFTKADLEERKFWPKYQEAYEQAISHTSQKHAPWYVVPADDKHNARVIVSEVILDCLRDLKLKPPVTTAEQKVELEEAQRAL